MWGGCTALPRRTALHFVEEVRDGDEVGAAAGADPARDEVFVERFECMAAGRRVHAAEAQDGRTTGSEAMPPRRCLLCGEQAQVCARSRRHSVEDLTERISKMLSAYLHH